MLAAGVGGQGERLAGRRRKMAVESRVTQEEIKKEPEKPIDREKTCPLLLRVFTTNNGRHHRMDEFSRGNVPSSELQIYTWTDDSMTLQSQKFQIGDYLDIAITPPNRAPPPSGRMRPY
ncbi:histone deacetylase complex subunit SAP18 [Cebus imitator]|uniref:histone deacetylase complex subunit SAP18 n=1 Tax=Cebus imitator TaxID=2715852 RepID=UPI000809E13D|nr:histone deacetylase complex subunit SAP18 [Cebus imitator]